MLGTPVALSSGRFSATIPTAGASGLVVWAPACLGDERGSAWAVPNG